VVERDVHEGAKGGADEAEVESKRSGGDNDGEEDLKGVNDELGEVMREEDSPVRVCHAVKSSNTSEISRISESSQQSEVEERRTGMRSLTHHNRSTCSRRLCRSR
jgi:hypothetical protein